MDLHNSHHISNDSLKLCPGEKMDVDEHRISIGSDEDMFATSFEKDVESSECNELIQDLNKEISWRGSPITEMPRNFDKYLFPQVEEGPNHTVLFKLPVKEGEVPKPWPEKAKDVWDQHHVRMPHSTHNLYPVSSTELRIRWKLVLESLQTRISTSQQLEAAILHYNSMYSDRWNFNAMHSFFSQALEEVETEYFFTNVLGKVIDLALKLPNLVTNGIPLLTQHNSHSISFTQEQVSCLLANAFLCTFPRRNTTKKNSEYSTYPDINFNRLFCGDRAEAKGRINSLHEKLKCLINYFRRVTIKVPEGVVTYTRHFVPPDTLPVWSSHTAKLNKLHVTYTGTIEDGGTGMLEMDFANKFVGGGVLGCGCVQEEIRFVTYPELILARLFTEVLDETEALIVRGCERFNEYQGYANSFEWDGNRDDCTPRDKFGRRSCTVVAVDAFRFPNTKAQYTPASINRELNKAYAGFSWGYKEGCRESVATGNWGCGAFRGDAHLKSLIQLMAAATTGRPLVYFTFGDKQLLHSLADMHQFLVDQQITVGDLWKVITSYSPNTYVHSLYDHIYNSVKTGSVPKPSSPRAFKMAKFQKKIEKKEKNQLKISQESPGKTSHGLNNDEIEKALEEYDIADDSPKVGQPGIAKTLNVQQDKDLCLKRLSSSWTNLNQSKKDFKPILNNAGTSQKDTVVTENKKPIAKNKKNKISDYFQPVPKTIIKTN